MAPSVRGRADYECLKVILTDDPGGVDDVITELRRLERKLRAEMGPPVEAAPPAPAPEPAAPSEGGATGEGGEVGLG